MPYSATAIKVMLASPSDVPRERDLARGVIAEWNAIYSESTALVLMPISWDTHFSPDTSGSPQDAVNKQLLDGCDLLIAIFWTRIGTRTGRSRSGTVQEIRKHIAAGKQALLFVSSAPVVPDAIDEDQYKALQAFKAQCVKKGIWIEPYETLAEYEHKLRSKLGHTLIRHFYPKQG